MRARRLVVLVPAVVLVAACSTGIGTSGASTSV